MYLVVVICLVFLASSELKCPLLCDICERSRKNGRMLRNSKRTLRRRWKDGGAIGVILKYERYTVLNVCVFLLLDVLMQ